MKLNEYKAICFVAMPFGKKSDLAIGKEIDFDRIYRLSIKPAIEEAGLEPLRGDEEETGGIIHTAMFARLLLSEYAVADLTLANPNVFYELGIRHAARPFTTVPIYANIHPLPFDVAMVRAIGYHLDNGIISEEAAKDLKFEIQNRLQQAINGPPTKDSPLFQLIPSYPTIDLPHEVTDIFQERVTHEKKFRELLAQAKSKPTNEERCLALRTVTQELGDLKKVQANILVDLMLSFRSVEAWSEMVKLCESFPDYVKDYVMVRQQLAFALNRRNRSGDKERAISILEELIEEYGPDPETLGILGRVHKDRFREAKEKESILASAALDDSISAYVKGFESDPRDYYPGVNAITLLIEKGDGESLKRAEQLVPLVSFAVARRGGLSSSNYWDLATVLELNCISGDWPSAEHALPKVLDRAKESWMPKTTLGNLIMLKQVRSRQGQNTKELEGIIENIKKYITDLSRVEEAKK
ncbi:Uncharacterised protein [uncultured archaeon]|nr:Uncharacterised protein [uncultured archaeon]